MIPKGYLRKDEYGRNYRYVWLHGNEEPDGRLYETLFDSRQQPKSLAFRLMEKRNESNHSKR